MSPLNVMITKSLRRSQISNLLCTSPSTLCKQFSTSTSLNSDNTKSEIGFPKRIQRGPADILKALASTVSRDPTAPHYKYHDDPYLIPASHYSKRTYALSQESGRKAAKWILQEHANLFQHKVADPPIEAFTPRQVITEESQVDVESLDKAIDNLAVGDSIKIYKLLEKNNISLSKDRLQKLLELVCYYNADEDAEDNSDLIEERWYKRTSQDKFNKTNQRKTWKDGGIAESIFLALDPPDSKSYSVLINGMGAYGQLDNAWKYYNEAKSNNITLLPSVYCTLIKSSGLLKEQSEARWDLIQQLLSEMNSNNISPDIHTLNAILQVLSHLIPNTSNKLNSLRTIAEFKKLGIEPTLTSYSYLLNLHCRDRTKTSAILVDIINVLMSRKFSIQDPNDTLFFSTAMEMANKHLSDVDIADKIHSLLSDGENYNLIGDSYKESVYYRNYFFLKCEYETIENFMEFYNLYVPNIYIPEPAVMEAILRAVDMNGAAEYLPRLWSDMLLFEQASRENLVSLLLDSMYRNPPTTDTTDHESLIQKLADTAESIYSKIEDLNTVVDNTRLNLMTVSWTGAMLGNVMAVLLRADRFEKACDILKKLDEEQQHVLGVPDARPLSMFVEKCVQKKNSHHAVLCLQYTYDIGYLNEIQKLGQLVYDKLKLTDSQLSRLKTIINQNTLTKTDAARE